MEQFQTSYYCALGQHGVATHNVVYQLTTGYGKDEHDNKSCFDCIGKDELLKLYAMPYGGKHFGYLTGDKKNGYYFSNWPSSIKEKLTYVKESTTNWNCKRIDGWFILTDPIGEQHYFWLKQIGDNNQCAYVRKVKPF